MANSNSTRLIDMTSQRFGRLTAARKMPRSIPRKAALRAILEAGGTGEKGKSR
jgi:hypothetical protein